jgi:NAD(P)H-dependent FMN reductase
LRAQAIEHRPRILLLYGSLRERSFSRFDLEAISAMSCEATRFS